MLDMLRCFPMSVSPRHALMPRNNGYVHRSTTYRHEICFVTAVFRLPLSSVVCKEPPPGADMLAIVISAKDLSNDLRSTLALSRVLPGQRIAVNNSARSFRQTLFVSIKGSPRRASASPPGRGSAGVAEFATA